MEFSEKLKEIRTRQRLSQEGLAEKLNVSRQAITKWETGRGLPDIENMRILAEIFKTTLDDLLNESSVHGEKPVPYASESLYDIDGNKHFDIKIGSCSCITLTSGNDEKLFIRLESSEIENIASVFKVRFDDNRNRLDVDCLCKEKMSRFAAQESLNVFIRLPKDFAEHAEIAASAKKLIIEDFTSQRLEYDGDAEIIQIKNSSGSLEFTGKSDYDITVDKVCGSLEVYQFKAKAKVRIAESVCPPVLNKGRMCKLFFTKNGKPKEKEFAKTAEAADKIVLSGLFSEMTVELG